MESHWQEFQSCNSLPVFKDKILRLFRSSPTKSIFRIHNHRSLKYIFQIRVGLSALRSNKRRLDTTSDWCACNSSLESISHFLFKYHLLHTQSVQLYNEVHQILTKYN